MYFPHISLVALALAPACMAVEHQAHMHKRAAAKYTTVTYSFVSMVTTTSEMVISSNIQETGPATIIPGTLTMTFNVLPAYLYLETAKVSTFRSTITRTTTSKLAAGKTVTSSTAANTATAAAEVPKGSVTTSAASPKTTSAAGSATTTATSPKTTSSIPAAYLSDNSNCGYEGHYVSLNPSTNLNSITETLKSADQGAIVEMGFAITSPLTLTTVGLLVTL